MKHIEDLFALLEDISGRPILYVYQALCGYIGQNVSISGIQWIYYMLWISEAYWSIIVHANN